MNIFSHAYKPVALILWLLVAATALVADDKAQGELTVSFDSSGVLVNGISGGGEVIVYSVERRSPYINQRVMRVRRRILPESGGAARVSLQEPPSPQSLWLFVDEKSGRFSVSRPDGNVLHRCLPETFMKKPSGNDDGFTVALPMVDVLIVQPGRGAYLTTITDGGAGDGDGALNGEILCTSGKMKDFKGGDKKASKLATDDFVFVMDPRSLCYFAGRLK